MRRSPSINEKLNLRLTNDPVVSEVNEMIEKLESKSGFKNAKELASYLAEGALLNVGRLASKALSVPCGDYMVWMTDVGHTMLVPVSELTNKTAEVLEHTSDSYDIFTKTLLQNWHKLERTLTEAKNDDEDDEDYDDEDYDDEDEEDDDEDYDDEDEDEEDDEEDEDEGVGEEPDEDDEADDDSEFQTGVDEKSVNRKSLLRSMEDAGYTVTSLANEVGVDPSTISRMLRTPKDRSGDPGGRNPSIGMASAITHKLRASPTTLFPDIFAGRTSEQYKPKDVKSNKASGKFTHFGESDQNLLRLCEAIELSGMSFKTYWKTFGLPTIKEGNHIDGDSLIAALMKPLRHIAEDMMPPAAQPKKPVARSFFGMPAAAEAFKEKERQEGAEFLSRMSAKKPTNIEKIIRSRIVQPMLEQFKTAMDSFLAKYRSAQYVSQNTDKRLTGAGLFSDEYAAHKWFAAKDFYNKILKFANSYMPKYTTKAKETPLAYQKEYEEAAAAAKKKKS